MLTPDQFRVNEAWIVVRVNEDFLFVKDDPYDMYVLMDAASCYVLGHVLSRVTDEAPDEKQVEALFKEAWEAKEQWAEKLILIKNSIAENEGRTLYSLKAFIIIEYSAPNRSFPISLKK